MAIVFFEKGRKYAIVGISGSGKRTLLKVLMKYFLDYQGEIKYGQTEARKADKASINEYISYIQQNVIIFNASIRDNITMFDSCSNMDEIVSKAGLTEVVKRFEAGVDGLLEEEGKNLSGGEKQRISITRAFCRKTPVLIVDEATSSLDNITARQIEESILSNDEITTIVVTHKLEESILKKYDEIIVLKNGEVVEQSNFETLMDKKRIFYSLYLADN